jgi:cellulose synthase/poly-beta-1,6-N-acetylglucosamine synthase-like glycosyltransferase
MTTIPKISILILTFNAIGYVYKTLDSLQRLTPDIDYEVIVVDNNSRLGLKLSLPLMLKRGWIDKLCLLNYNSLFAEGNNVASRLARPDATHFLLLNSDVEIRDPNWLKVLLNSHEEGITSYGVVPSNPIARVDGYCFLIDKPLYQKHLLDESHQWWWAITKLQAKVLTDGYSVKGYAEHEQYLHHFGGKSGKGFKKAKGMDINPDEVIGWFNNKSIEIVDVAPQP